MTRRQRLLRCSAHEHNAIDRVPVNYLVGRGEMSKRLLDHFGVSSHPDLINKLDIDGMDPWGWALVEPEYHGPGSGQSEHPYVTFEAWGFSNDYATPMRDCDSLGELKRYRYPRVADFDFSGMAAGLQRVLDKDMVTLFGPVSVGFTHHVRMRGFERAFIDLMDERWMLCFQKYVSAFYQGFLDTLFKATRGRLDFIHLDEDVGAEDRMMISPDLWRKYYKPYWKIVCDLAKKNGVKLWMHSCGYCRDIIDDFVELSIDVLNPIPPHVAGNDPQQLKRLYGEQICFDGGIDQPTIMIAGTPEQVEEEVRRKIDILAPGGGFMIQPSQGLTADMPLENIERFFQAALKYGGY